MNNYTKADLRKIFTLTERSLFAASPLTKKELDANFKHFKTIHKSKNSFSDFYWKLVLVTFYSGFRATTVDEKYKGIKKAFGNYKKVALLKAIDQKKLLKDASIIRHSEKIKACIHNAKAIINLTTEFKSVESYKLSFGDLQQEQNLNKFIRDLRKRFKYLGKITVYHLLTEIGVNVAKPDRVLCRIFYRLGLISSVTDTHAVINAARNIATATAHPIRYIDIIFVYYGQLAYKVELNSKIEICTERKPQCNICSLTNYCNYYNKN